MPRREGGSCVPGKFLKDSIQILCTNEWIEFQHDHAQRVPSSGASDSDYNTPCQGHDPVHASVFDDSLFLDTAAQHRPIFNQDILDCFWSHHDHKPNLLDGIRSFEWDVRGQAHLSKPHTDGGGFGQGKVERKKRSEREKKVDEGFAKILRTRVAD